MAVRKIVIGVLFACAVPASASVVVLGASDARLCFEAADSPLMPQLRDMQRCNDALTVGNMSNYETVATHVNRGILRLRRGLIDESIADFDAAMVLDPNQPEAYLNKGAALIRRQNPAE